MADDQQREAVARAMCEASPEHDGWPYADEIERESWLHLADAALAALTPVQPDPLRAGVEALVAGAKGRVWPRSMDWTHRSRGYNDVIDLLRALLAKHPAPVVAQETASAERITLALVHLVRLKAGPRDEAYEREKPRAWAEATAALLGLRVEADENPADETEMV